MSEERIEISTAVTSRAVVVTVAGELDVYAAPFLRDHMAAVLTAEPARFVVVDLARVVFLDSTALGVLVAALKRARAEGGDLRVGVGTNATVRRVFEVTGLLHAFGIDE